MRVPSLTLAAAGAALLAPAALPVPATAVPPRERPAATDEGRVTAAELLARTDTCAQVSRGRYRTDADTAATVPVCGTREAVFWKADLDIDCDGRPTARCNRRTDPLFAPATAFQQSDGRHLNAERLPYIVVPGPSRRWNQRAHGVRGGSVAAVVYRDRVRYAVVGDTGPRDLIGEASYATARSLGIPPDPRSGGAPSGVTYIVFRHSRVTPIEDHAAAVAEGRRLAGRFITAAVADLPWRAVLGHPIPR
ncbi:glycoside hydrolase family 75 protein [Streptomyces sp. NPDC100445]|uniref:glycoside hydrolase family 75 protein n=1 Tax=Streptomyces sp. NPDC100445 TaxID=3366102 RepID=UPI00381A9766